MTTTIGSLMRCDKCKMPKGGTGLDQCFCEPEKASSGGIVVEWHYCRNVWARFVLPDGYTRLKMGTILEDGDLVLDCCVTIGGYLERNHGDLIVMGHRGPPDAVVDVPLEVYCDQWEPIGSVPVLSRVDDDWVGRVPSHDEDDSLIFIRKVVKE